MGGTVLFVVTANLMMSLIGTLEQERVMSDQTTRKVSSRHAAEIHAGVERIYAEGKGQERAMTEPRYVYDLNEGFFVDMGNPDPDDPTMGSEMYVTEVADRLNELEAKLSKMEELKTYAMLLEGKVSLDLLDWLFETRRLLGLEKEMINWLIPDEHRGALAGGDDEQAR